GTTGDHLDRGDRLAARPRDLRDPRHGADRRMSQPRDHPYRLYGALALLVVAGLIALCLASFKQVFTSTADVKVHIARAGQQLLPGSDVKLRGIDVGEVN